MGTKVKNLQLWCKKMADGYRDVEVRDMTASWKSGLAFCAIIHRFRPDLIDYDSLSKENVFDNNNLAFEVAEKELDIPAFLDAADMVAIKVPDKLSVVTYVSQYYNYFHNKPQLGGPGVKKAGSLKRAPSADSSQGPEPKRFTPNKQDNTVKQQATMGDKCTICDGKVYLLERQMEGGKLYHRACFRQSELSPTRKMYKRPDVVTPSKGETTPEPNFWQRRAETKKETNTPVVPKVTSSVKPLDSKKDKQELKKKEVSSDKDSEKNNSVPFWKKSKPGNLDLSGANVKGAKTKNDISVSPKPSPRHLKQDKTNISDKIDDREIEAMDVFESDIKPKPTPRGSLKRNEIKPQDLKSNESAILTPPRKGRYKSPVANLSSPESPPPLPSTKPPPLPSSSVPSFPGASPTVTSSASASGSISSPNSRNNKSPPARPKSSPSWFKSPTHQGSGVKPSELDLKGSKEKPGFKFSANLNSSEPSKLSPNSSPVAPKSSPKNDKEPHVSKFPQKLSPHLGDKGESDELMAPTKPSRVSQNSPSPMDIDEIIKLQDRRSKDGETVAVLVSPTSPQQNDEKDRNVLSGLLKNLKNVRQKDQKNKLDPTQENVKEMNPRTTDSISNSGDNISKTKVKNTDSDKKNMPVTSYVAKSDEKSKGEKQPRVKAFISAKSNKLDDKETKHDDGKPKYSPRVKTTVPASKLEDKASDDLPKPRVRVVVGQNNTNKSDKDKIENKKMEIEISKVNDNIPEWKRRLEESRKAFSAKTLDQNEKPETSSSGVKGYQSSSPVNVKKSKSMENLLEDNNSDTSNKSNVVTKKPPRPKTPDILHRKSEEPSKPLWQLEAEKRAAARQGGYADPEKNKPGIKSTSVSGNVEKLKGSEIEDKDSTKNKPEAKRRILPSVPVEPSPVSDTDKQRKKISVGMKFDFNLSKKEEEAPKYPPPRPPPPSPGVDFDQRKSGKRNQAPTPRSSLRRKEGDMKRMSPMEIQKQLMDIDSRLTHLELRGRNLEDSIRKEEEEDEDMMIEWFHLVNEKNELIRKEADLIYAARAQELEDEQQDIDKQIRELMAKPEEEMTKEEKEEADLLLQKLVDVVNQRSLIVDSQDEDRIRYIAEDKDIEAMLEAKGFVKRK